MIELVPMKYFTMHLRVTNYTKNFENYSLAKTMYGRRNAATSDLSSEHSSITYHPKCEPIRQCDCYRSLSKLNQCVQSFAMNLSPSKMKLVTNVPKPI